VTPAAIASAPSAWTAIEALTVAVTSAANAPSAICKRSKWTSYSPSPGPDMNAGQQQPKQDDNIQDADFEEVK